MATYEGVFHEPLPPPSEERCEVATTNPPRPGEQRTVVKTPAGRRLLARLSARRAALLQRLRPTPDPAPSNPSAREPLAEVDLNRVYLTGVLGSEPLLYDLGDHPVAWLALTCQRRWRTAGGSIQLETIWFNLSAWEELAEQCGRQLHRGDRIYVEGRLHLWSELRGPQSYACHTILLDRIVLLAAGEGALEAAPPRPRLSH